MDEDHIFLTDKTEQTTTRFVSFMGENQRFDLGITKSNRYKDKALVFEIQTGRFAIIGKEELEEPHFLEHSFDLNEQDAEDLKSFLVEAIHS